MFIPFNGCPHRCSFCDQRSITGESRQPSPDDVRRAIETAIDSLEENTYQAEVAFFGGSFTAVDRGYMLSLLEATVPYIDRFKGIRVSTRPDAIDGEVLSLLKRYKVTSIELGAQSMSDEVLSANGRGHTADDVRNASRLITEGGFELGLQMMTGLYKSSDELDRYTAHEFIKLAPSVVRIYPTIVMKGTRLGELYESGLYEPQSLESAVELCSGLLSLFEENGIRVIRLGLHDSPSLRRDMLSGPYHPAFRELCESRIMLSRLFEILSGKAPGNYRAAVEPRSRSKLVGNKKCNLTALAQRGYTLEITEDDTIAPLEVVLV